jgi:hypothetical protein
MKEENFYTYKQAESKANKMREKVESGKVANFDDAENLVEEEKQKRKIEQEPITKKIEIPGLGEIEYVERKVLFPEKYVEETGGVKGYIKKTITWEKLLKFWDIDKNEWEKIKKHRFSITAESSKEKDNKYPKEESAEKLEKTDCLSAFALALTDGVFINQTLNHVVYGANDRQLMVDRKFLKQDLLEKINIKKEKGLSLNEGVSRDADGNSSKYTYTESDYGLSLTNPGELWTGLSFKFESDQINDRLDFDNIVLGFKLNTQNKVLRDYCKKTAELYEEQDESVEIKGKESQNNKLREQCEKTMKAILNPVSYFKEDKYGEEKQIADNIYGYTLEDLERGIHPRIPIIINHPEIPELRWCHADYAAIPTKEGYNILEMIT